MRILLLFILFTTSLNAQNSWRIVPNAPWDVRIEDVSFINATAGFLEASDSIYRTNDGGNTWVGVGAFPPGYVRSIEFINDSVGFIGTLDQPPVPAAIFKTTNGGATWTNINSLLTNPPVNGICGIAHHNNLVIAVGSVISEANVYVSNNAGSTWSYINLASFANELIDVYILDSLTWMIAGKSASAPANRACIIRTNDGGLTWNRVATANAAGTYCWKIFMQPNGIGVASVEDFGDASIFKTTDNGNTWIEMNINVTGAIDIGAISILNDTLIFTGAQHNTGNYYSRDGGLNWSSNFVGSNMNRMVIPDGITPLCVGETVYKWGTSTGLVKHQTPKNSHILNVYPTIVKEILNVDVELLSQTTVLLTLLNTEGKVVRKIEFAKHQKGKYKYEVNVENLPSGNYILQLITNEQNFGRKIIIE
jgi:photosystem II stability/assembly factor-like uncharacterized protein